MLRGHVLRTNPRGALRVALAAVSDDRFSPYPGERKSDAQRRERQQVLLQLAVAKYDEQVLCAAPHTLVVNATAGSATVGL